MTEEARKLLFNFREFAPKFLKIKNKRQEIVPFKLNTIQNKFLDVFEMLEARGKPIRIIVLKARKMGISTLVEGIFYHRTTTQFNVKTNITAHEIDASNNLFEMCKLFHDETDKAMQPIIRHSNAKELSFEKLRSLITIKTAEGGGNVGRSDTINNLHGSEVAFWGKPKHTLNALLNAVPKEPGSCVILESTANGLGGEFYNRWDAAKKGESEYYPVFLAWWEMPEYRIEFDNEYMKEMFVKSLDEEEKELQKLYNLAPEQLHWRRDTIKNECGGDIMLFRQENPSNDIECFIASGRPVFDPVICRRRWEKASEEKFLQGNLEFIRDSNLAVIGIKFVPDEKGFLRIYHDIKISPYDKLRFCAGSDVAEGLEQGDFSTIAVWDRKYKRVALEWYGHIDPDLLALEQLKIKLFLKECYFCTERNNHGLTTIVGAFKYGVPQYSKQEFDGGYQKDTDHIGYRTESRDSKEWVIDMLKEKIREDNLNSNSIIFWEESLTFVTNSKGRMQAQDKDKDPSVKCFDDMVIAYGLMFECDRWLPKYTSIDEKKPTKNSGRRTSRTQGKNKQRTLSTY